MKKFFTVLLVLFGVSLAVFADAKSRKQIDSFMKEYETFVVKVEKAADTNKLSDYANFTTEYLKLIEKVDAMENTNDWTISDSQKYLELTNRYTIAVNKLSGQTSTNVDDTNAALDSYNEMLKSYGY